MKIYTGIGSRETPAHVLEIMDEAAFWLAKEGWVLRSGGANGADAAFERGCIRAGGSKEIYLSWDGFNGKRANPEQGYFVLNEPDAQRIARRFHPNWDRLGRGGKAHMQRNTHQVLGADMMQPTRMILCYTPNAALTGGTAQALRLAQYHDIPVQNLGEATCLERISRWIESKLQS